MPDPLILHAPTLDATAGAHLLRERWPGAEVREMVTVDMRELRGLADGRDVWLFGFGVEEPPTYALTGVTTVDPTPDASIAMQVWRKLHDASECCPSSGEPHGMHQPDCQGAPTWLRHLDDAVCERWALPHAKAVWAFVHSFPPADRLELLKRSLFVGRDQPAGRDVALAGAAILRARERWEEHDQAHCEVCACDPDGGLVCWDCAEAAGEQLRVERDALRERLGKLSDILDRTEGIDVGATGVAETMTEQQWESARALCELVGVGRE